MLAAAMPFPREETTPPVTKMYLAMNGDRSLKQLRDTLEVLGCIDAERFVFCFRYPDRVTVLKCPQLFQSLGLLQRADRQVGVIQQQIPPVDVQTAVLESRHTVCVPLANVGDGESGEVDG